MLASLFLTILNGSLLTTKRPFLPPPSLIGWITASIEDGQVIGRIYEDRQTLPALRWFWSITEYVDPALPITRNGRAPSLEDAKARFRASWSKWRAASKQKEQQQP